MLVLHKIVKFSYSAVKSASRLGCLQISSLGNRFHYKNNTSIKAIQWYGS